MFDIVLFKDLLVFWVTTLILDYLKQYVSRMVHMNYSTPYTVTV